MVAKRKYINKIRLHLELILTSGNYKDQCNRRDFVINSTGFPSGTNKKKNAVSSASIGFDMETVSWEKHSFLCCTYSGVIASYHGQCLPSHAYKAKAEGTECAVP